MSTESKIGTVGWFDLTVPDAEKVRAFYETVVGWKATPLSMGDYNDFCMSPAGSDDAVAGICHARGQNTGVPAQWLMYIIVENVEAASNRCRESGGKVLHGPRTIGGYGTMCVIQDPAGAVAALYQPLPK